MLNRNIHILLPFLLLLCSMQACIEPYEAEVEEESRVLVVEGSIVKGDSIQTFEVFGGSGSC